jgi:hypothetical protein
MNRQIIIWGIIIIAEHNDDFTSCISRTATNYGYSINMFYHDLVILMHPEGYDECAVDVVDVNEDYHVKHKHTLILNAILFIGLPMLILALALGVPEDMVDVAALNDPSLSFEVRFRALTQGVSVYVSDHGAFIR